MIVRSLDQILGSAAEVQAPTWTSRRLLLRADAMGFSLHDTLIAAGTETTMWYRHHLEAVYCIAGEGSVEALGTGEVWAITSGTLYALDQHDRHVLRATTEMRMICVFNPPLTGRETHDENGVYPRVVDTDGEPTATHGVRAR